MADARKPIDTFRGRDVLKAKARLKKVGDGLSTALDLEDSFPLLEHGDRIVLVVEAVVSHIDTAPAIKGDLRGPLDYVYDFDGETVALADTPQNRKILDKMRGKIDKAKQIEGQRSIDDEEEEAAGGGLHAVPEPEWDDDGSE